MNIEGNAGRFRVTIKKRARFIDANKCTGCGTCINHCPVQFKPSDIPQYPSKPISEELKKTLDAIIYQNKFRKENLIGILQDINGTFNYIPPESLPYLSEILKIPLTRIYHVATFYTSFTLKPRGKYIIKVCMGTACMVRGSQRLVDLFQDILKIRVGETTQDKKYTLETVNCLGACAMGPVVTVNDKYFSVTPSRAEKFLRSIQ